MKKIDVSFDSETWGTNPGCDIRSIGAIRFDPRTGNIGDWKDGWPGVHSEFYQALDNPTVEPDAGHPDTDPEFVAAWNEMERLGYIYSDGNIEKVYMGWRLRGTSKLTYSLTRDPRTVQWWSEQSKEAQAAFVKPMELRQGLILFGGWLRGLSDDTYDPADLKRVFPDDRNLWSHGSAFDPPVIAAAYRACGLPVPWHYRAPRDTRTCFDMAGIDDHSAWLASLPGPLGIPHHALDDSICQARAVCAAYERNRWMSNDRMAEAFHGGWKYAMDAVMPGRVGQPLNRDQAYESFRTVVK